MIRLNLNFTTLVKLRGEHKCPLEDENEWVFWKEIRDDSHTKRYLRVEISEQLSGDDSEIPRQISIKIKKITCKLENT